MKTIKITSLFVLLLFITTSCLDDIWLEGNGIVRTESRVASGFYAVTSSGDFDVIIVPGSKYSVEITAESNLLPYIETDVVGNTLKIRSRGLYTLRETEDIEIYITTPVLTAVALSGSGFIQTGNFMCDDFYVTLSGSGDIDAEVSAEQIKANVSGSGTIFLAGDTYDGEFVISGSGKIKSYNLEQSFCQATISGSGDMYVNVSDEIDAHISGSGRVYFINYPVVHTSVSGSGGVVDRN